MLVMAAPQIPRHRVRSHLHLWLISFVKFNFYLTRMKIAASQIIGVRLATATLLNASGPVLAQTDFRRYNEVVASSLADTVSALEHWSVFTKANNILSLTNEPN
jgi:hypothetical protein